MADALQRRAMINGGIAGLVTLVVGIAVVAAASGRDPETPLVSPSPSPTPPAPACVPSWDIVQSAEPGQVSNMLHGITALAAPEAWSVGASGDPEGPADVLIERWDGSAWTAEEAPNPGSQINELLAVDAAGPDVWAVGRTASGFGDRPLVLHFDGIQWVAMELPEEVSGRLTGVAAIAPDDVWVVGFSGTADALTERALLAHWDGALWAVVSGGRAVGVGRSALLDVEAVPPEDVWAIGYLHNRPLTIRFDGEAWSRVEGQTRGTANAIEPVSPTDVWAVGSPIQRYDGVGWAAPTNVRGDGELVSVAAVSADDVWAVGSTPLDEGTSRALVMRFDGRRWTQVAGPGVPGSEVLTSVDALPDGTVLAVGYRDVASGRRTMAIRAAACPATA